MFGQSAQQQRGPDFSFMSPVKQMPPIPPSVHVKMEQGAHPPRELIPELDQLFLPASMPKELRIEVGRTLKSLSKEYEKMDQLPSKFHSEYVKMENWSEEQKEQRRKKQNREAAQRSRIKKMEMVWALVKGVQELYRANWAFQQQAQNLQKHSNIITQLQQEVIRLRSENQRLKGGNSASTAAAPASASTVQGQVLGPNQGHAQVKQQVPQPQTGATQFQSNLQGFGAHQHQQPMMGGPGHQQLQDIPPSVGSGRTPVAQQPQGNNPYAQNQPQQQQHAMGQNSPLKQDDTMFGVQNLISSLDEIMKMSIDQQMQNQYARLGQACGAINKMDANLNALMQQGQAPTSPKVRKQKTSWDPLKTDDTL